VFFWRRGKRKKKRKEGTGTPHGRREKNFKKEGVHFCSQHCTRLPGGEAEGDSLTTVLVGGSGKIVLRLICQKREPEKKAFDVKGEGSLPLLVLRKVNKKNVRRPKALTSVAEKEKRPKVGQALGESKQKE